jgi:hypothetical protein
MLPTTGLVGGCGIGLSLFFFGAIVNLFPLNSVVIASEAKQSIFPLAALWIASSLRSSQ